VDVELQDSGPSRVLSEGQTRAGEAVRGLKGRQGCVLGADDGWSSESNRLTQLRIMTSEPRVTLDSPDICKFKEKCVLWAYAEKVAKTSRCFKLLNISAVSALLMESWGHYYDNNVKCRTENLI